MNTFREKIGQYVQKNKWLLAGFLFFVVWKIFLVGVLWADRDIPPVIDDSLVYILHINGTLECSNFLSCNEQVINFQSFAGFDHLTYRLILGTFGKLFAWDSYETYRYGFYIGTLLLGFALFRFATRLYPGQTKLAAYILILFALFSGSGSYHGFYWIVPSLFAFVFFILILGSLISEQEPPRWWQLSIFTFLGIFSHVLFLYSLFIFIFFFSFQCLFTRTFVLNTFKKIAFVVLLGAALYLFTEWHFRQRESLNPYGPLAVTTEILTSEGSSLTSQEIWEKVKDGNFTGLVPGWQNINHNYFRWIFYSFWGYVALCVCFGVLLHAKQFKILSLYFGSLTLTLASTLSLYGERSLLFLWPFTFLYFGLGLWFFWKTVRFYLKPIALKLVVKISMALVFSFFTILMLFYSYLWNDYLNESAKYTIETEMFSYLEELPEGQTVFYSDKAYFIEQLFFVRNTAVKPTRTLEKEKATYFLTVSEVTVRADRENQLILFQTFFETLNLLPGFKKRNQVIDPPYSELPLSNEQSFRLEKRFGDINLYRIEPR